VSFFFVSVFCCQGLWLSVVGCFFVTVLVTLVLGAQDLKPRGFQCRCVAGCMNVLLPRPFHMLVPYICPAPHAFPLHTSISLRISL
jgi:hypothetical protein